MKTRKHLFLDLEPYVCTFECELSNYTFANRREWYQHERQMHRSEYHCNHAGHESFTDRREFGDHMKIHHDINFDHSQAQGALGMFVRPNASQKGVCPLCGVEAKKLESHLARHLERLALFALPRDHGIDEGVKEDDSNASVNMVLGSRNSVSQADDPQDRDSSCSSHSMSFNNPVPSATLLQQPVSNRMQVSETESIPASISVEEMAAMNYPATVPDSAPIDWDFATPKFRNARQIAQTLPHEPKDDGQEKSYHSSKDGSHIQTDEDVHDSAKRIKDEELSKQDLDAGSEPDFSANTLVTNEYNLSFKLSGVPEIEQFIGRDVELSEMQQVFQADASGRRTVVLHGPGGIGKTQLAVAYAKQHRDDYSAILWLHSKYRDTLDQSLARAVQQLVEEHPSWAALQGVSEDNLSSKDAQIILRWLEQPQNRRWLLILDGVNDPVLFSNDVSQHDSHPCLPRSGHGHILITTRIYDLEMGPLVSRSWHFDIDGLDPYASIQVLVHKTGRPDAAQGKPFPEKYAALD